MRWFLKGEQESNEQAEGEHLGQFEGMDVRCNMAYLRVAKVCGGWCSYKVVRDKGGEGPRRTQKSFHAMLGARPYPEDLWK